MSQTDGSESRAEAVEGEFVRLLRQCFATPRAPEFLIPSEILQAAALALIETRPVPENVFARFCAEAAPILRRALARWTEESGADLPLKTGLALPVTAIQLDAALTRLEAADPALAWLIEARCYGALEAEDAARWRIARAWLQDALSAA